ncbi:MAG: DUF5320 domain-containing protein [Dehalococcoidales bacterium]
MAYGNNQGQGRRGGAGLGFRGSSPPYPYVGRGRGGLPRCQYPGAVTTFRDTPFPGYPAQVSPEQELDLLKKQAGDIKEKLGKIESRIRDLEVNKKE